MSELELINEDEFCSECEEFTLKESKGIIKCTNCKAKFKLVPDKPPGKADPNLASFQDFWGSEVDPPKEFVIENWNELDEERKIKWGYLK